MTQELELMRTIISMSSAIENVTNAMKAAETSLANGEAELMDLEKQLSLRKQELIDILTQ
jgi:phage-related minor tail protein